jgi:acyl-coenzyme A thioesterase PaaI-like protein
MLTHTRDELQALFLGMTGRTAGDAGILSIDHYGEDLIVASAHFDDSHLRPGGVIAGPNLFMVVDSMGYLVTMSRAPKGSNGFSSAISMQFLRPAPVRGLRVEGRLLKFGKRSSVVDTVLYSDGLEEPVAQGVVTYVPLFPASD